MIVLPLLQGLWTMLAAMVTGGVAAAYLDRKFATSRFPVGLCVIVILFAEELVVLLLAHFNGDVKAPLLIWPLVLFFVALAMVYGITKAALWAWPHGKVSR